MKYKSSDSVISSYLHQIISTPIGLAFLLHGAYIVIRIQNNYQRHVISVGVALGRTPSQSHRFNRVQSHTSDRAVYSCSRSCLQPCTQLGTSLRLSGHSLRPTFLGFSRPSSYVKYNDSHLVGAGHTRYVMWRHNIIFVELKLQGRGYLNHVYTTKCRAACVVSSFVVLL